MFTGFLPIYLSLLVLSVSSLLCLLLYCVRRFRSIPADTKVADTVRELGIEKDDTNIAVCGAYKGGKSRLINGLSSVSNIEPGAAPLNEFSSAIKRYAHKDHDLNHLVFWEFPGTGNPHVSHGFQYRYDFRAWDCVLIVIGDALRDEEIWLADLISQNVRFAVVKSKCDRDLEQIERDNPTKTPEQIKHEFYITSHQLLEADLGPQIAAKANCFLVSGTCFEDSESSYRMDEDKLQQFIGNVNQETRVSSRDNDAYEHQEFP